MTALTHMEHQAKLAREAGAHPESLLLAADCIAFVREYHAAMQLEPQDFIGLLENFGNQHDALAARIAAASKESA